MAVPNVFVGAKKLSSRLKQGGVKVFDCSFYLPSAKRNAFEEWQQKRIPGSSFFDIDQVCDTNDPLPHMLPAPEQFWSHMEKEGDFEEVCLYDCSGYYTASARVFWMCKIFGLDAVTILDGGLQSWESAGLQIEQGEEQQTATKKEESEGKPLRWDRTVMKEHLLFDKAKISSLIAQREKDPSSSSLIIDARGAGRFSGEEKEARPGIRSGHIPTSANLPYAELFTEGGGSFLPQEVVREKFEAIGVKFDSSSPSNEPQIVTSCGSGVTGAVLSLALHYCGLPLPSLYDGSWTDWGKEGNGFPVVGKGGKILE